MGLLQAAYRTYETYADRAGSLQNEEKEALTPISHIVMNAQIEITLSKEGVFQSARAVPKGENKTIVPATIESANRTNTFYPHPLCDQLPCLAPYGGKKFEDYISQLGEWAESEFSHPTVRAVFTYIKGGTILRDLANADLIVLDEFGIPSDGKVEGTEYAKCLVRWRVIPDHPSACWQNPALFDCFARLYAAKCQEEPKDLCFISGQMDMICEMHPKGVVALSYGAKLVSANDKSGFTYRGRFTNARQASSVGYTASQKAHSALRWLSVNHGVIWGGRTFLCWNPEGKPVPSVNALWTREEDEEKRTFTSYQNELKKTLGGYENQLKPEDDVVVAALDAATTGRLSVTYYQELKSSDFLAHIERWYTTCCWDCAFYGIQSPPVRRIVTFAYGTERGDRMDVEDKLLREHAQRVLSCMIDCRPIPKDLVRALVTRAGNPLGYNHRNRESLLTIACALIRKYRNDDACKADREHNRKENEEEWKLALDTTNNDRSYLFGRWLAVMEHVERSTYDDSVKREPNATRMQAVFVRRPLHTSRILTEQLEPYFEKLHPNARIRYRRIIEEIVDMFDSRDLELEKSLEDVYLLGYYHQRSALYRKKDKEEN